MPKRLKCPKCGCASIGFWRQQFLGPARTIRCNACGARVSISWIYYIPVLVLIAAIGVTSVLGVWPSELFRFLAVSALIFLAMSVYLHYLVPLVVRSSPD